MNMPGRGLAAIILGLLCTGVLWAAPLSVLPARVELSDATPSVQLTVRNDGARTMVVQMEAMVRARGAVAFAHEATGDVQAATRTDAAGDMQAATRTDAAGAEYEATGDVQATPPTFTLEPGATQTVQVALRTPAAVSRHLD